MNPDLEDILSAFAEKGVEYLVVGAYALAAHGVPRATGDRDIGAVFGEASALEEARHPSELPLNCRDADGSLC